MRKVMITASALLTLAPSQAVAASATINISGVVPVMCTVDVLGGSVSQGRVVINVHRNCNSYHSLVFTGPSDDSLGSMTFRYNNQPIFMDAAYGTIDQPERYYDGVDQVIIESPTATSESLEHFAESLSIGIVAD